MKTDLAFFFFNNKLKYLKTNKLYTKQFLKAQVTIQLIVISQDTENNCAIMS